MELANKPIQRKINMKNLIKQIHSDKLQLASEFLHLKEMLSDGSSIVKMVTQCRFIINTYDKLQLKELVLEEIE